MRYTISINQKQAIDMELTNINQLFIFDMLTTAAVWAKVTMIEGEVYYWVARQAVIKELPILGLKSDTVYRHLKALADLKLIDYTKEGRKDCVRITDKGRQYLSEANPNNDHNSEIDPAKLGSRSELSSEVNPTYKNTKLDQVTTLSKENPPPTKPTFELPVEVNVETWSRYEAHRKHLRKPMSADAKVLQSNVLKNISHDDQDFLVNYSISGNYPSLYLNQLEKRNGTRSNKAISGQLTGAAARSADFHEDLKLIASGMGSETVQQDADTLYPPMDKRIPHH